MISPLALPTSSHESSQVTAYDYAAKVIAAQDVRMVLDFGCGVGHTRSFFQGLSSRIHWFGVDIPYSREVSERTEAYHIVTYDGLHVPFSEGTFDLVFSRQVMEHVRYPEQVLAEVFRVLRPGGHFVGSTSHVELYHSRSYWNFTPWGFCRLLEDAGFDVREVRPGIDGLTLFIRRLLYYHRFFDRFFERESPLNWAIEIAGRLTRRSPREINQIKLQYCGQFAFWAVKPFPRE